MDTSADAPAGGRRRRRRPSPRRSRRRRESVSQAEAMDTNPDQRGTTDGKEHPAALPFGRGRRGRAGGAAVLGSCSRGDKDAPAFFFFWLLARGARRRRARAGRQLAAVRH